MIVNPEMLLIARDVRGLTCEQAAEQMSIEWGTLSRYENGLLPVPEDDLKIISKALKFPASFFCQQGRRSKIVHDCKHGIIYK